MTFRSVNRIANASGIQCHTSRGGNFTVFQHRQFTTFVRQFSKQQVAPASKIFGFSTPQQLLQFQRRFQTSFASTGNQSQHGQYNLFARYIRFCNEQQMAAAIVTSFVLWSLGDVITQKLESVTAMDTDMKNNSSTMPPSLTSSFSFLNYKRLAATAFFGVSIAGVGGFYWYRLLDKAVTQWLRITPSKSGYARFTAAKLGLEFLVWHPLSLAIFWLYLGVLSEGKSLSAISKQLVTDLPTAIAADMCLWLPIDIINFRFMPVHLQVIVVNLGSLFEAVLLSYLHGAGGGHGHGSSPSGNEHDADRHVHGAKDDYEVSTTHHHSVSTQGKGTCQPKRTWIPLLSETNEEDKVHWL